MAEAIGIISGSITLVKLFHTAVQVFEIVNTSRAYSSEIHVLCTKLELERIRLLSWGELVGLTEINEIGPQPKSDSRLYDLRYRYQIAHCLKHLLELFKKVDGLLEKHGVRLNYADGDIQMEGDTSTVTATASNKQRVKSPVHEIYPHELGILRKSIKTTKPVWGGFERLNGLSTKGTALRTLLKKSRISWMGCPRSCRTLVHERQSG